MAEKQASWQLQPGRDEGQCREAGQREPPNTPFWNLGVVTGKLTHKPTKHSLVLPPRWLCISGAHKNPNINMSVWAHFLSLQRTNGHSVSENATWLAQEQEPDKTTLLGNTWDTVSLQLCSYTLILRSWAFYTVAQGLHSPAVPLYQCPTDWEL